jgi:Hemerythrin HHE cation binding domain
VEEEGLFPFVRANLPAKAAGVDRLAVVHDTICGAVVRLTHAADTSPAGEDRAALAALYERFEAAYTLHSREEADLFAELASVLEARARADLAEVLRGL